MNQKLRVTWEGGREGRRDGVPEAGALCAQGVGSGSSREAKWDEQIIKVQVHEMLIMVSFTCLPLGRTNGGLMLFLHRGASVFGELQIFISVFLPS